MGWQGEKKSGLVRGLSIAAAAVIAGQLLVAAAPSAAADHYSPVQPGAFLYDGCTMNFIYEDSGGQLYTATAGHCYDEGVKVRTAGGEIFGEVVYSIFQQGGALDVALIEIDGNWNGTIDPSVRHWGGPVGTAAPTSGSTTLHYGHGLGPGNAEPTRPRVGVVDESTQFTVRVYPTNLGDSGSPILDEDGNAVGISSQIHAGGGAWWTPIISTVLDHLANQGWDLTVKTAPLNQGVVDRRVAQAEHCLGVPAGPSGCVGSVPGVSAV